MRSKHLVMKNFEGKNEFVHRFIWKICNFDIPKGFMIHHKDDNSLNNLPENLELVGRKLHGARHRELNITKDLNSSHTE